MSKAPSKCVFCGGGPITKEHIWSDWLKDLVGEGATHNRQTRTRVQLADPATNTSLLVGPLFEKKRGAVHQKKIRKVCINCNNRWMSTVVNEAKAAARAMIEDLASLVPFEDQTKVATWLTLSSIMAEYTDPPTQVIPTSDRKKLMETRVPLDTWSILVGRYKGKDWSPIRYRHLSVSFIPWVGSPPGPSAIASAERDYLQVTNLVLGRAFFHIVSSSHAETRSLFNSAWSRPGQLARIWPRRSSALDWSALPILTDAALSTAADEFFNWRVSSFSP